ncbi:MAG: hypothetical protein KF912_10415 [Phycisphaeraceae bacterium]|nr:hypothetical protein [Phycisphaeraceae bacterium]MBX3367711.1 hypothetical protein [Phycisphaeraceae bacterium]
MSGSTLASRVPSAAPLIVHSFKAHPKTSDPLTSLSRWLVPVMCIAALPALAWAMWPLRSPEIPRVKDGEAGPSLAVTQTAFDADAFATPLWVAPPAPPTPPPPTPPPESPPAPPPPAPLKVQLLSILREPSGNRAMFYDPDTKKVLTLAVGDPVGAASDKRTIASISDREVEINGPRGTQTLSLREPPPTSTTPSKSGRSR